MKPRTGGQNKIFRAFIMAAIAWRQGYKGSKKRKLKSVIMRESPVTLTSKAYITLLKSQIMLSNV
jgi:hypothetical protein